MIQVDRQVHGALWGLVLVVVASIWMAWSLLGNGNLVFETVVFILSFALVGGMLAIVRRRPKQQG